MNINAKTYQYLSKKSFTNRYLLDRKLKRIFEPSNGGIGIKLKTPKIMFITTIRAKTSTNGDGKKLYATLKRIKIPKIIASKKFDPGPATATIASPYLCLIL